MNMLPQLEATNSRVAIVIATDGSNYNKDTIGNHLTEDERMQDVRAALESLQGLPVNVVIRLCSDYSPLVHFYNDLDTSLPDLSLDVIDDYEISGYISKIDATDDKLYSLVTSGVRQYYT